MRFGRRRLARPGVLAAVVLAAAACGGTATPTPPGERSTSPSSSRGASGSVPTVVVDPALLDILPAEADGIPIEPEPDVAAQLAADPSVAGEIEALALAMAVDQGGEGESFAIVNVVRPRPGLLDDAFFRSWRDTYDEAACAPAGGVEGNAEAELGGRRVHIGTCAGGAHTYHVAHESGAIVSITATGRERLGEAIVEGLGR